MTREELFKNNIEIAFKIANKYAKSYSREKEDLHQEALIGLWKATEHFDENRGYAFSTFAGEVIKNEIFMYFRRLRKNGNPISLYTPIADNLCIENVLKEEKDCIQELEEIIELNRKKDFVNLQINKKPDKTQYKILKLLMEGCTVKEVSIKLGVAVAHVYSAKHYASKTLKKLYAKEKEGAINVS